MAYLEARAGIARAKVTYAGWAAPRWTITVGGDDHTSDILTGGFTIQRSMNSPTATMTFRTTGWTPVVGSRVVVQYCTPNELLFSGHLVRRRLSIQQPTPAIYECECVSDVWAMDLYKPRGIIHARGLRPAIEQLLTWCGSDSPAVTAGSIPSTMTDIGDTVLDGSRTVSQVLSDWVSLSDGAYWRLRPSRAVDVFVAGGLPDGNGETLINTSAISRLTETQDISQIATLGFAVGPSAQVTATSPPLTTTIAVDDCAKFLRTGIDVADGGVISRSGLNGYSAVSAGSGPGTITLSTALEHEVPEGSRVAHIAFVQDAAAGAAFDALAEAGSAAERWVLDAASSPAAAAKRASAIVDSYKTAVTSITYRTTARRVAPGQTIVVNITAPVTVAGTFVALEVVTTVRGRSTATRADLWHDVTLGQVDRRVLNRLFYSSPPTAPQPDYGPLVPPGFLSGVR